MPWRIDDGGTPFIDSLGNVVEGREKMRVGWAKYFQHGSGLHGRHRRDLLRWPRGGDAGHGAGNLCGRWEMKAENRWTTPTAFRAFIQEQKVAEWRVYCDNEPIRQRMAKSG